MWGAKPPTFRTVFPGPRGRPDLKNAPHKIRPDCLQVPRAKLTALGRQRAARLTGLQVKPHIPYLHPPYKPPTSKTYMETFRVALRPQQFWCRRLEDHITQAQTYIGPPRPPPCRLKRRPTHGELKRPRKLLRIRPENFDFEPDLG